MAEKTPNQQSPSLQHAELRLVLFLEELEQAVENADRLASAGLAEDAIRIIDLQRDALKHLPEQLAADISPPKPRISRRIAVGAAAAVLSIAGMAAAAVGLIGRDQLTAEAVAKKISAAERMRDTAAGLDSLEQAIAEIESLDADEATRTSLSRQAAQVARNWADKGRQNSDEPLTDRATQLARLARSQVPAPGENGSPVDGLLDDL